MPKHALPSGAEPRARRRAAGRRRNRDDGLQILVMSTAFVIVESAIAAGSGGGVPGAVLNVLRGCALGAVAGAVLWRMIVAARRLSQRQLRARPRWQYLLFALGYSGLAVFGLLAEQRHRPGWLAGAAGMFGLWTGTAALAMAGRALSWGRVRRAMFWYRPRWLTAGPGNGADGADGADRPGSPT